ncbi:cyclic nucleotide-binding domain-containing protein [Aureimonas sp. AU22]|jgi:CRP/FNR family transcriptional regulator, cyclic AMP receptor protein|uniref:cyclic nucleotide-binding domain-containing protein n=1 Tax=Aureimonas sp. AU22 TaxID=1638162 RepID=UPI00078666A1|nr:cyclic nucleotide-binding domain-containing protein [Aureimonas sp. AU22]
MSLLVDEVEVLRRAPLFQGVALSRLKLVAFTSQVMRFSGGDALFHQGDVGDSAYLILSGEAIVVAESPIGEIELARLGPNEVVGEIGILCDIPRTATVRAAGDLATLRMGKECLSDMMDAFPSMARVMLREMAMRLNRTSAELVSARAAAAQLT